MKGADAYLSSRSPLLIKILTPLYLWCFRIKEQRERVDKEHQEELDHYHRTTRELKVKIDDLSTQLDEKQVGSYYIRIN